MTFAAALLVNTETTCAILVFEKYFIIFSALVPDPEAKTTIFFIIWFILRMQKTE
jgi:hypothetical protein